MEDIKLTLKDVVSRQLAAAPESVAKAEMIEELTDNLYCRYEELVAGGMSREEALAKAGDALGDAGELVDYLESLEPDQPLPGGSADKAEDDVQVEKVLRMVEDIVKSALGKAKSVARDVKENMEESGVFVWKSNEEKPCQDADFEETLDEAEAQVEAEPAREEKKSWKVTAEVDPQRGKFVVGREPVENDGEKEILYGFGYDKDKGGFFTQQGEWKPAAQPITGPVPSDALKGIDVQAAINGDVTIRMTQEPEGDVLVGGDTNELEVSRTEGGVLRIRPGVTESASFLLRRGLSQANVELSLPRRAWDFLRVNVTNGDVYLEGEQSVGQVQVTTTNGDVEGRLAQCHSVLIKSANGDINWKGDVEELFRVDSAAGDIRAEGRMGRAQVKSMSGDVELSGVLHGVSCASLSGDVQVTSEVLPGELSLASTSGDCQAHIPACGGFSASLKTRSGDISCDFTREDRGMQFTMGPGKGHELNFTYMDGGPAYTISSLSGDVSLEQY